MAKTGMTVGLINALMDPADPAVITEAVEGWLDDHPEATTTVEDGSITKAKLDSNLAGAIDDVSELKTAIDNAESNINNHFPYSRAFRWVLGSLSSDGRALVSTTRIRTASYTTFKAGTHFKLLSDSVKYRIYFYTTPNEADNVVDSMSGYWHTEEYTIDATHASYYAKILLAYADDAVIADVDTLSKLISVVVPASGTDIDAAIGIVTKNGFVITDKTDTLNANTEFVLANHVDNRMNGILDLWAEFETFDSVTVGHGLGAYGGYVVVDSVNATVYYDGTAYKTYKHGLTITDFIEIHVAQTINAAVNFVITTANGNWSSSESANQWHGCKGEIVAKATMAMQNVRFSATFPDFVKDCIIFGDSYATPGDNGKWPFHVLTTYKASNFALVGYGGASSANEILSFRNIVANNRPLWLGWFIGMNDPDSSTGVDATWKQYVDEVIDTCTRYGITPVLATIPCTPTQRNDYKNAYVRNSGYPYVDFAKAVDGEAVGATWYAGMLSSDNVHPTQLGAKALACRLIADMPQVI